MGETDRHEPASSQTEDLGQTVPSATPSDDSPAGWIGEYQVTGELGRGGMGVVYRARHPRLAREVALKVLLAGEGASDTQRERFWLEAQAAARLRHPHLVSIHDVGEHEGRPFLVMDFVEGESLDARLRRAGPLEPRLAAELCKKLAHALQYAHGQLILHRDVKPANVLLTPAGEPLLADFGLAKVMQPEGAERGPTKAGQILGTPSFMAPEQASGGGRAVDQRADVYALGATLYALLCGEPPFQGETLLELLAQMASEEPVPLSELRPEVERDLETICLKCLEKEPEQRYANAQALADDLGRYLRGESIVARPPTRRERLGKWGRRNPTLARGIALALAALVVVGASTVWWAGAREERARVETRQRLVAQARQAAEAAEARLADAPVEDADERTARGLEALQATQRWYVLAPDAGEAAEARYRAAMALGGIALASEQWALAARAFGQAEGLGVDDARASAARQGVGEAREAERRRRRAEIEALLDRVEAGELAGETAGLSDAVFRIARYPELATVELLCARLDAISAELLRVETAVYLEAREPNAEEARSGGERIEGLAAALEISARTLPGEPLSDDASSALREAAQRLEARARRGSSPGSRQKPPAAGQLVASRQREALGCGRLDVARVACESLGRIGIGGGAIKALGRYLRAQADELRAVPAGIALCRLGGERARGLVFWARRCHGINGPFTRQVDRALALAKTGQRTPRLLEETPAGYSRRGQERQAQGDLAGAFADYDRALELDPSSALAWSNRGIVRQAQGDPAGAFADFDRAIEIDPSYATGWNNRGGALHAQGDLAGAIADYERALEIDPAYAHAWNNRGSARYDQGDLAGAFADFDRAIEIDPAYAWGWTCRGVARHAQADFAGAIADYDRALEIDPSCAGAWSNRGLARQLLGDLVGALADYDRAIDLDPNHATVWANRGGAREAQGDLTGAIVEYDRALELDPNHVMAWIRRGGARWGRRDLAGAIADYDRALELDPSNVVAWTNRGSTRRAQGDLAGAIADFDRAIELDPSHPSAWTNRGNARRAQGDLAGAIADYDRAIEIDPSLASAWTNRGNARYAQEDLAGAIADFDRALEIDPSYTSALTNRGAARQAQGDLAGAIADYDQALLIDPSLVEVLFNRGNLRRARGDLAGAIADYDRAIGIDPGCAAAWVNRGNVRRTQGDLEGALTDLDWALELDPGCAAAWINRGLARRALGDLTGAIADLERFLELAPRHRAAGRAQAALSDLRARTR